MAYGITADVQQKKHPVLSILQTLALFALLKLTPDSKRFVFGAISAGKDTTSARLKEDVSEMLRLLQSREITPLIAARFPLKEASRAHDLLESSKAMGKIILVMD
ncbi:MAG: zinc-binding dehydrogenase [Cytophagales bacterium]|nr:zinc-binding dehydrogenase [Armatimonadota bacterium]